MPTIHFFVRSNNDINKTFVLYCRVKVNGTTSEFSTKEKIDLACWNQSSQKYKCKSKTKTHYVNSLLETISYKIKTKSLQFNDELSAKELIQKVFEREKKEKTLKLLEIIDLYIDELKQRGTTTSGTIKNHTIKKNNLEIFQTFTKQIFDAENFTPVVAEQFKEWFRVTKKTENVTSSNRNVLFYKIALMLGHNSVKTTELYYLGKSFNRIENELKHRQKKALNESRLLDLKIMCFNDGLRIGIINVWNHFI